MNSEDWFWIALILALAVVGFGGIIYGGTAYPTHEETGIITHIITYQGDNSPRQIITVNVGSRMLNVTATCDFYKVGQMLQVEFFPQGHWWIWVPPGTFSTPPVIANPYGGC